MTVFAHKSLCRAALCTPAQKKPFYFLQLRHRRGVVFVNASSLQALSRAAEWYYNIIGEPFCEVDFVGECYMVRARQSSGQGTSEAVAASRTDHTPGPELL